LALSENREERRGYLLMRSPSRLVLIIILVVLALGSGFYILTTPGRKPIVVSIYEPPIISVEERIQDIGQVPTDTKQQTFFLLYNIGGKHLRISEVETSCGCTVADISKKVVAPGDFTRIKVELDTSIKMGKLRKKITVHSNDPKRPELVLFVLGDVFGKKMEGHAQITLKPKDKLVLFKGNCASCHVDLGRGKTGKALFLADCAMCHGSQALGNHSAGVSLLGGDYENEAFRKRIRGIIADGSPHSPQMPPFSKKNGGPLNDDEIDSLVSFLKFQNMQHKMGLLSKPDESELEDEAAFEEALKQPH
jgi:mono/diheme cytochrome c family protein